MGAQGVGGGDLGRAEEEGGPLLGKMEMAHFSEGSRALKPRTLPGKMELVHPSSLIHHTGKGRSVGTGSLWKQLQARLPDVQLGSPRRCCLSHNCSFFLLEAHSAPLRRTAPFEHHLWSHPRGWGLEKRKGRVEGPPTLWLTAALNLPSCVLGLTLLLESSGSDWGSAPMTFRI